MEFYGHGRILKSLFGIYPWVPVSRMGLFEDHVKETCVMKTDEGTKACVWCS